MSVYEWRYESAFKDPHGGTPMERWVLWRDKAHKVTSFDIPAALADAICSAYAAMEKRPPATGTTAASSGAAGGA